eukprot:TRINITY_DN12_c0_g1_i10.p2 TRINITY_DN12_c0_g1~~TRINITY_DN12_c0_g1_i10.p2  ORF type:complete len:110 (+),score=0.71 TRINITY_DN12_c0_g1_i10:773-1102(+)
MELKVLWRGKLKEFIHTFDSLISSLTKLTPSIIIHHSHHPHITPLIPPSNLPAFEYPLSPPIPSWSVDPFPLLHPVTHISLPLPSPTLSPHHYTYHHYISSSPSSNSHC